MTAIWDKLTWKAQYLVKDFDEVKAHKLRMVLKEIYEVIKFHDEYKNLNALLGYIHATNLLEVLNEITLEKFNNVSCDKAHHIIEALHDFDHAHDGHHTEHLIMKINKKTGQQMLLNISYDDWWNDEGEFAK